MTSVTVTLPAEKTVKLEFSVQNILHVVLKCAKDHNYTEFNLAI